MATVPFSFVPPLDPDITILHIFESNNALTGFVEIDQTPAGSYPDYITRFVTQKANNANDWFAIQWEDSSGAKSDLSTPIQGGTTTLIGELVERTLLRNADLNENLVLQEAESTVSFIYKVTDPYSIDILTVNKLWLTELANLTYVAAMYFQAVENNATFASYSAGMISESTGTSIKDILDSLEQLERRALRRLGIGGSRLAQIEGRSRKIIENSGLVVSLDSSRLLSTKAIITEKMLVQDIPSGFVISDS